MSLQPTDRQAYHFLEAGPVLLVSTANEDGKNQNLMTMGFHMIVRHPDIIGAVIGPWDFSYQALKDTGQCVLAIPTIDLAEKMVDIGNCSGREVDKFSHFELTPLPAEIVCAPLVKECLVNIECSVIDTSLLGRYDMFILRAENIWLDNDRKEKRTLHHRGDGTFSVDGEVLNFQDRMILWKYLQ